MTSARHPVLPAASTLDAFCALLQARLAYLPGERDMVVMHHEFGVELANGAVERQTSTLVAYGDPDGYSAMARTVALPAAIATEMLLSGALGPNRRGIVTPVHKDIYDPVLARLEDIDDRYLTRQPDDPPNLVRVRGDVVQGLPFSDATFDLVRQSAMVVTIQRRDWPAAVREMRRVVRPGGYVEMLEPYWPFVPKGPAVMEMNAL
ncbi:hypothetical protein HK405_015191, partial [Cladochytrium tenue]